MFHGNNFKGSTPSSVQKSRSRQDEAPLPKKREDPLVRSRVFSLATLENVCGGLPLMTEGLIQDDEAIRC